MKQFTINLLVLCVVIGSSSSAQNAQDRNRENDQRSARFQQFFSLPGIDFSKKQQAEIAELRKEFVPKLRENQRKWNGVLTQEQRQARRKAFQQARDAGKRGRALRSVVDEAIQLTDQQRKQRTAIREERNKLRSRIRTELNALLTGEQQSRLRRRRQVQQQISPTHADVKYGRYERNVMDVWLAKSDKPTPVLVSIHGGGFRGGNKNVNAGLLRQCLDSGISVVAITYRLSNQAIAPAQFHDAARAIQFVRYKADDWNLDAKRIAATGGSAGAGLSLWLGFHDDLADPGKHDPVLRQSTRLTCMMVNGGQTSYDPRFIRDLFPEFPVYKHSALAQLYGVDLDKLDDLPEEKYRLFEEVSPVTHLTKDDPPAMLSYGRSLDQKVTSHGAGIHHARFGKVLKKKMDALGIRCVVIAGGEVLGGGKRVSAFEFMRQEFGMTD